MPNTVLYGPHLFPGGPELYIRKGNLRITDKESHENIRQTLISAFSKRNSNQVLSQISQRCDIDSDVPVELAFMNYGDTQLVYLATLADKVKVAALINQPHTPLGKVKKEFHNLQRLVKIDPRFVVEPYAYFSKGNHELYVSSYVDKAMCVYCNLDAPWGVYDPVPAYHFESLSPEIGHALTSSMMALLVNYYDEQKGKGLAQTQISGNDFILTRDFKKDNPNTVLPNMRLIAARGFVEASLEKYLGILREEFLIGSHYTDPSVVGGNFKVNHKSLLPLTEAEIEEGIELGLRLRGQRHLR